MSTGLSVNSVSQHVANGSTSTPVVNNVSTNRTSAHGQHKSNQHAHANSEGSTRYLGNRGDMKARKGRPHHHVNGTNTSLVS